MLFFNINRWCQSDLFVMNLKAGNMHTRLTALFPGLTGWAGTRKVKPIWILLKQETVTGNGIRWDICKSAPSSRQITMPAPHHSVFTGRMPFLPPNQQRQSTEGETSKLVNSQQNIFWTSYIIKTFKILFCNIFIEWPSYVIPRQVPTDNMRLT